MITAIFQAIGGIVHSVLGGLDGLANIFRPSPPIIPEYTRLKMVEYGISQSELIRAFRSGRTEPGYKPGSTCGVYFTREKAIGAVYIRDEKNPKKFVIIGCWSRRKSQFRNRRASA